MQEFISRFSANASKSKQATSRKRALEKSNWTKSSLPAGSILMWISARIAKSAMRFTVEGISKTIDGVKILDNITFTVGHNDKIAFVGGNELAKTTFPNPDGRTGAG